MLFRKHTLAVLATDLLLVGVAWLAAFWLRFNFEVPAEFESLAVAAAPLPLALYAGALVFFHVHRQVWRFAGLRELQQLAQAVVVGGVVTAAAVLMLRLPNFPRSVLLLRWCCCSAWRCCPCCAHWWIWRRGIGAGCAAAAPACWHWWCSCTERSSGGTSCCWCRTVGATCWWRAMPGGGY